MLCALAEHLSWVSEAAELCQQGWLRNVKMPFTESQRGQCFIAEGQAGISQLYWSSGVFRHSKIEKSYRRVRGLLLHMEIWKQVFRSDFSSGGGGLFQLPLLSL